MSLQNISRECENVLREIKFGVESAEVYSSNKDGFVLKIITKENQTLFVLMNERGFKLTMEQDQDIEDEDSYFEILATLLMENSPKYKETFHTTLFKKLENLQEDDSEEDEEEQ